MSQVIVNQQLLRDIPEQIIDNLWESPPHSVNELASADLAFLNPHFDTEFVKAIEQCLLNRGKYANDSQSDFSETLSYVKQLAGGRTA